MCMSTWIHIDDLYVYMHSVAMGRIDQTITKETLRYA